MDGRVSPHHRWLLGELMRHLEFIEATMERLDTEIAARVKPFEEAVPRLCQVPGIERVAAWGLLAEIGLGMNQFPDAQHLAKGWASARAIGRAPASAGVGEPGKAACGYDAACVKRPSGSRPSRRTTCRCCSADWPPAAG